MKKHVLWMFSHPKDNAGKSKLTVADLVRVSDVFAIPESFDGFPEDLSNIPADTELFIDASIYEADGEIFFDVEFRHASDQEPNTIWQLHEELPSEDAQWWMGVLPEFYGWPLEPQVGAFGYKFTGEEMCYHHTDPDDESVGIRIFRHHGSEPNINLRKTVGAAIKKVMDEQDEFFSFEPAAFTIIPVFNPADENDDSLWLLIWEIEEHSFTRDLCPAPQIFKITGETIEIVDDGLDGIIAEIDEWLKSGFASEEVFATCGIAQAGFDE